MFTYEELKTIDRSYFEVFEVSPLYVRIMSKNSRHYWRIYADKNKCLIQHTHNSIDAFHNHGVAKSLKAAISAIKQHDTYQLTHRRRELHRWDEYAPKPSNFLNYF